MNLLPHKSWNVWSAKNRSRVERDEEQQKIQEDAKRKRQLDVDQEQRLDILRDRLKKKKFEDDNSNDTNVGYSSSSSSIGGGSGPLPILPNNRKLDDQDSMQISPQQKPLSLLESQQHINLFAGFDQPTTNSNSNNNVTKPMSQQMIERATKERDDRLNNPFRLGHGSVELSTSKPWYLNEDGSTTTSTNTNITANGVMDRKEMKKQGRENWVKQQEDPLTLVDRALGRKNDTTITKLTSTSPPKSKGGKKSIEELRKERLERETKEREKARIVTNANRPPSTIAPTKQDIEDSRIQQSNRYTTQYTKYSGGTSRSTTSYHNTHNAYNY